MADQDSIIVRWVDAAALHQEMGEVSIPFF